MERLSETIISEIEYILEGCRSGKLQHNQQSYNCSTAHCIAGWYVVFKHSESKEKLKHDFVIEDTTPWVEAQSDWGLSNSEANILFSSEAEFVYQFALLDWFKQGKRVKDLPCDFIDVVQYNSNDIPTVFCNMQDIYNYCEDENITIESPEFLKLKQILQNAKEFVEFCEERIFDKVSK